MSQIPPSITFLHQRMANAVFNTQHPWQDDLFLEDNGLSTMVSASRMELINEKVRLSTMVSASRMELINEKVAVGASEFTPTQFPPNPAFPPHRRFLFHRLTTSRLRTKKEIMGYIEDLTLLSLVEPRFFKGAQELVNLFVARESDLLASTASEATTALALATETARARALAAEAAQLAAEATRAARALRVAAAAAANPGDIDADNTDPADSSSLIVATETTVVVVDPAPVTVEAFAGTPPLPVVEATDLFTPSDPTSPVSIARVVATLDKSPIRRKGPIRKVRQPFVDLRCRRQRSESEDSPSPPERGVKRVKLEEDTDFDFDS
ncbi:hypothetical protein K435DRAFT_860621 [Dendrothele bispora CBS 962.96]|uniref:Uncharacterized protein n=1 Tax=Dendrothele bispora (strain CBS 962.96) TaxID=1314807 RepID=A0A4S8LXU1_DENBC|nr:hypothetical protein K435DRAFT_860621 [Dendrothele bispora CBS 962.96]